MAEADEPTLADLMERHLPALQAYVRLQLGPKLRAREGSADLVQSVCRELLKDQKQFRYEGDAAFRAWLYTQAIRKIRHRAGHWAAAKREQEPAPAGGETSDGALLEAYGAICTPSRAVMAKEAVDKIERAFAELPADYREVILLARMVGLKRGEIAERLGRTEAAIRNLLPRALAALSDLLEKA